VSKNTTPRKIFLSRFSASGGPYVLENISYDECYLWYRPIIHTRLHKLDSAFRRERSKLLQSEEEPHPDVDSTPLDSHERDVDVGTEIADGID